MTRQSAKSPRVSEKVEQAHIVQLIRSVGGRAYVLGTRRRSTDYPGTMQTPGLPDLLTFLPSQGNGRRVLMIECKAAGGRLRPEQQAFRDLCCGSNADYVTGNLDAVIAWLCARGYVKAESFPHYRQSREFSPVKAEGR